MNVWIVRADWYDTDVWDLGVFTSLGLAAKVAINHLLFNNSGEELDAHISSIQWNFSHTTYSIYLTSNYDYHSIVGDITIQRIIINDI